METTILLLVFVVLPVVVMGGTAAFGVAYRFYARSRRGRLVESLRGAGLLPESTMEDDVHWQVALRAGPAIQVTASFLPETALQARLGLALEVPPLSLLPVEPDRPRPPLVADLRTSDAVTEARMNLRGRARDVELVVRDDHLVFRCAASPDAMQRADALIDEAIAPLLARLWRDRRPFRDELPLCPWDTEPFVARDTAPDDLFCPRCKRQVLAPERAAHMFERAGHDIAELRGRAQRARRAYPCGLCGTHLSDLRADKRKLTLCEGCGAVYGSPRDLKALLRFE